MAEKSSLKEEVKKLINSFLCGYQKGATIKELDNDYTMMEGTHIPFRKLGYTTVEDFLRSIPDAVTLNWERGECYVRAVANENNQRILNLVSKQKSSSKKGGSRRPPARRGYGGNRGAAARYVPPRMNRNRPPPSTYSRPGLPPPLPTVPNFILTKVRELFASYKDGLNASNFEMAFSRRFGGRINFKELGFHTLYDFLMAMPDVVQLEKFAGGLYRIYAKNRPPEHIAATQRRETPSHRTRMLSVSDDEEDIGEVRVAQKWQLLIRKVLEKHPDGIWSTQFTSEFKRTTGEELPFKRLGFHSVIEMMSALPAIVTIERPSSLDWLLFDARIKTERRLTYQRPAIPESEQTKVFSSGQERFKEALRQVLLAHSEGILLGELESEFKDLTGQDIPFEDLGYSDIENLVTSEQNQDILNIKYEGHGQVFVYGIPTSKKFPDLLIKSPQPKEPKRKIPMDAVGPGNCYKAIDVPSDLQYMVVYVSNVETPGQLWIQLRGENTTDALEDLMDRLEDFYMSGHCQDYAMPDSLIKPGQVCAALFAEDNNWHRVTITDVRQDGFIEVYYVDYGSTSCVSVNSIMMLKSQFLQLPAQALKARLANLQPPEGDRWPTTARVKLLNLVAEKPLVAMPTYISEDGVISLCLCDTSGDEDVHINDLLVSSGLAQMLYDNYSLPVSTGHKATEVLLGSPKGPLGDIHKDPSTADLKLRGLGNAHSAVEQTQSEQSENETESETEQTEDEYVRNIKFVELTERYSVHLVKYNDELYCCSAEVSALIWEKDLLRSMLRQKKATFDKVTLSSEEQPDIFEELKEYKVKGTMERDQLKSHVTIFKLDVVIEILKLFDHQSRDLIDAIQRELDTFDPNAPYWRGADSEVESDQEGSSDLDLDRADLETACNHLQLQRKKILNQLRNDPEHVTTYVDELDKVERQLVEVRCRLNQLSKTKENQTDLTEEEKFVQLCVEEQYKDCQQPQSAAKTTRPKEKPSKQVQPVVQEKQPASPIKKTNPVAPMPIKTAEESSTKVEDPPTSGDKVNSMFASMSMGNTSQQTPQAAFNAYSSVNPGMIPPFPNMAGGNFAAGSAMMNPLMMTNQLPPEQQRLLMNYQVLMSQMVMNQQNMAMPGMGPRMPNFNPQQFQMYSNNPSVNPMMGAQQYGPFSTMHPLGGAQVFGQQQQFRPYGTQAANGQEFSSQFSTGNSQDVPQVHEPQMGMQYGPRSVPRNTEPTGPQQQFGSVSKQDK